MNKSPLRWLLKISIMLSTGVSANPVLHPMNANSLSLADLRGRWVFINYWASWCAPCKTEIAEINRFYAKNKNKIALFAVNYDAISIREQQQLIQQWGIQYPSLKTDPAASLQLGDIRGVPVTFVFNPQGQLTKTLYGPQTQKSLHAVMKLSA